MERAMEVKHWEFFADQRQALRVLLQDLGAVARALLERDLGESALLNTGISGRRRSVRDERKQNMTQLTFSHPPPVRMKQRWLQAT